MVDAIGELFAAAGSSIAEESEFLNEKSKNKTVLFRLLSYIIPMSILTGIYFWVISN
tara:strand:- start:3750 stop:3920 length:171 start_codon:yes stop_codon:yes gene_type:complete